MVVWSMDMWYDVHRRYVWQIMIQIGKRWYSLYSAQSTAAATLKIQKNLHLLTLKFYFHLKKNTITNERW